MQVTVTLAITLSCNKEDATPQEVKAAFYDAFHELSTRCGPFAYLEGDAEWAVTVEEAEEVEP